MAARSCLSPHVPLFPTVLEHVKKSRIPNDEELDITPMIDVTFLMLIFFMVASTMQGTPDLPLPPAETGTGITEKSSVVLTLLMVEDKPTLILGDQPGAPQGDLPDVANFVAKGVAEGRKNVILKADRDLPSSFVERVAKEANVEGVEAMFYGVTEP